MGKPPCNCLVMLTVVMHVFAMLVFVMLVFVMLVFVCACTVFVMLVIACCCNVLTKAASPCNSMNQNKRSARNPAQVNNTRIRSLLREPDFVSMVVEQYGKSELRGLMQSSMTTLLEGMLTVQVAQRLTTQLLQHMEEGLHADVAPKPQ